MGEKRWGRSELIGLTILWLVTLVAILVIGYFMVTEGFPTMTLGPKIFCLSIFVITLYVSVEKFERYIRLFWENITTKDTP